MKRRLRIGLGQLLVEGGEPQRNLRRAETLIDQAQKKHCDLVLLPECMDLGWTHPSAKKESLPIPGPLSDRLCRLATRKKMYICAGLTEKDADHTYNTAILIDPLGRIRIKYRKINLLALEQQFYAVGHWLGVVDTEFGTIGVNICADNYLNSLVIGHTLARMGAQIILSPSAWTCSYSQSESDNPYGDKWQKPFQILATLYDLVVVSATSVGVLIGGPYIGEKSVGCSLVVDKDGILIQGPYNEIASTLVVSDVRIPAKRRVMGTLIGDMLTQKDYRLDDLPRQKP